MTELEAYVIAKMCDSKLYSEEELKEFKERDYKVLGDKDAFMAYYYLSENVIWVDYLWADNKRKMLKICRELWTESVQAKCMILFNSNDFEKMFSNHAEKIYMWTKEL